MHFKFNQAGKTASTGPATAPISLICASLDSESVFFTLIVDCAAHVDTEDADLHCNNTVWARHTSCIVKSAGSTIPVAAVTLQPKRIWQTDG